MESNKKIGIGLGVAAGIAAVVGLTRRGEAGPEPGTSILSGTVSDAVTGEKIPGVIVTLEEGASVATGTEGQFLFPDLEPGVYDVTFTAGGYEGGAITVELEPGKTCTANVMLEPSEVAGCSLQGVVSDALTEDSIPGANVTLGETVTVTDSGGHYSFENVVPGEYSLVFTAEGYNDGSLPVTLESGETYEANVVLAPSGETTYTCPICGAVFDTEQELIDHLRDAHPEVDVRCRWVKAMDGTVTIGNRTHFRAEIMNMSSSSVSGYVYCIVTLPTGGVASIPSYRSVDLDPYGTGRWHKIVTWYYEPTVVGEYTIDVSGKTDEFSALENVAGQYWCPYGCIRPAIIGYGPKEQPWSDSCEYGRVGQNGECPVWGINDPPYYENAEDMISHLSAHVHSAYGWPSGNFSAKCPYCGERFQVGFSFDTVNKAPIRQRLCLTLFEHIRDRHNGFTAINTEPKRQEAKKVCTGKIWTGLWRKKKRYYGEGCQPPSYTEFINYLHEPRQRLLSCGETVFGSSNGTVVLYGEMDESYMWSALCEYYNLVPRYRKRMYFGDFNPCTRV